MSRTANVLLALSAVFLTAAVVVYYTPLPAGEATPDVRPLVAMGIGLAVLVYLVDARWVRRLIERGPFASTTQRLAVLIRQGTDFYGEVEGAAYKGARVPGSLFDRIERWGERADRLVKSRTNHDFEWSEGLKPLDRASEDGRSEALKYVGLRLRRLKRLHMDLVE